MSECSLCDCGAIAPGDISRRLVEYWPEGGHPDYLALKRDLEDEFGLSITVSGLKRHLDNHIFYTFSVGDRSGRDSTAVSLEGSS